MVAVDETKPCQKERNKNNNRASLEKQNRYEERNKTIGQDRVQMRKRIYKLKGKLSITRLPEPAAYCQSQHLQGEETLQHYTILPEHLALVMPVHQLRHQPIYSCYQWSMKHLRHHPRYILVNAEGLGLEHRRRKERKVIITFITNSFVSFCLRRDAIFLLGDFTINFSQFYLILELIYTLFITFMVNLYNNYCA